MRTMYDSTTAADIPADAAIVAGYISGTFAWSQADWDRFPNAVKVRIAVTAQTDDGTVLDVESGDALPHEAPRWVQLRRAAGVDPTVYCNLSNIDQLRAEFARQGVPEPHWWLAHYDNIPELPAGYIAKQYADQALIPGQPHYDLSVVADYWPGVDEGAPDMTAQQIYDLIAPLLQEKIVAPQADTNTAIKNALAALAANDQTEATRIINAIGQMLVAR